MEQLLKYCRYYKGEEQPLFEERNKVKLWYYERSWINDMSNNRDRLSTVIEEYIQCGLGLFEQFDNTPLSLKAVLFNRYAQTNYSIRLSVEPFKKLYRKYYN